MRSTEILHAHGGAGQIGGDVLFHQAVHKGPQFLGRQVLKGGALAAQGVFQRSSGSACR